MNLQNLRFLANIFTAGFLIAVNTSAHSVPISEIFSLGGGAFTQNHIYRIDLSSTTVTDLGSSGINFPTNLAMSPNRTLYFMNPFDSNGHALYSATLNSTNTALVGAPTLVANLPTSGLGIIDGLTVGPNGDLYMTGYGKSSIYRYDIANNVFSTEVHLVANSGGEYRSDLAFDPITGNLVGLGIQPDGTTRTLFEIAAVLLSDGIDNADTWHYFGGTSPWTTKVLNSSNELGSNPDGIAFDPTNGNLFMSGDGTGVYSYDRNTAVRGTLIAGTGDGNLNGLGFDLAYQTRKTTIPEPGTLALVLAACCSLSLFRKRVALDK